ncbi:site-specific DNA-methyltransferase [Neobacillus drentensis]|uniref:DNA-methyltransferase n=1 Tax=Neobacillus drentensis TaxID=220684 RepID=UPI0030038FB3
MFNNIVEKINKESFYYKDNNFILLKGDSLQLLSMIQDNSINMIFADPPYFLSNDGITCSSGKMVSVNKGNWDKGKEEFINKHTFNIEWLEKCKNPLSKDGTIWISGTFHNIYSIGAALEELNYKIINNITWYKTNASPNLSCRYFTHSTETVLWAKKSKKAKHTFNYEIMKEINGGKQMRDVWQIPTTKKSEKEFGKHPTQKPIELLKRIILSSTKEGDIILDPFNGSGTTGIVAAMLNRKYIGIDLEEEFLNLTIKRYKSLEQKQLSLNI